MSEQAAVWAGIGALASALILEVVRHFVGRHHQAAQHRHENNASLASRLSDAERDRDYWRDRYYSLLEARIQTPPILPPRPPTT
jgi:hypothetical protein